MVRCFIAIEIPGECRQELISAQEKLKKAPGLRANFVEGGNFHLTLRFLGELSESQIRKIKEIASKIKLRRFKAHFGKVGVFPSASFVRVIWMSLEPSEEAKRLARRINDYLGTIDEKFKSHVTLARVKEVINQRALEKALESIHVPEKEFEIKEFKLKKSTLTPKGPVYEDICTFPLG
ncbi:MAG TPA: RNA 2',3'-cyclic phosphodiesterase [Nanoarchaeota archaeon]|nr:MAG: 2'-5' RNA ligase [archaeon GW2011_AR6]MBS3082536.1 RNA 2',3'-cyclic phosphodiesterase [Candidatus Pacearchaeota archaeon]HIH17359.1 RNA 2',3'-cyclic phosphodiesterase [Nanoarchaeota archaeon]HIH33914.1 RNA 2',3'-cyclic phosphodiesterase [Nanoarchaeota archaeon]HIH51119.1 RNA 2',3'-cyclic phosphodiesterase [Nanoarchaeota archaeon]